MPVPSQIAYLIAAHGNPGHLSRLLRAVTTTRSHAFVHIDRKVALAPFRCDAPAGTRFCAERTRVYWGEFSQVEATLTLLREALADPRGFDYFVLLSGSDYPLRSARALEQFFARYAGSEFINLVPMPSERANKPLQRLRDYRVPSGDTTVLLKRATRRALVASAIMSRERDHAYALGALQPFGGSSWWALSRQACQHILAFVAGRPRIVDFFRNTWFPDEMFFQTILGNSGFAPRVRHNLTYVDWSAGGAHPAPISARHLSLLAADQPLIANDVYGTGELLFARKFSDRDAPLVDALDNLIARQRVPPNLARV